MPQPAHEYNDATRNMVRIAAMLGYTSKTIGQLLEITQHTLRKYYRQDIKMGKELVTVHVGAALIKKALAGDVAACRFYLKAKDRWTDNDQQTPEEEGSFSEWRANLERPALPGGRADSVLEGETVPDGEGRLGDRPGELSGEDSGGAGEGPSRLGEIRARHREDGD